MLRLATTAGFSITSAAKTGRSVSKSGSAVFPRLFNDATLLNSTSIRKFSKTLVGKCVIELSIGKTSLKSNQPAPASESARVVPYSF